MREFFLWHPSILFIPYIGIPVYKIAFSLLMECYFLVDSQFLVYKLVRFAYNWDNEMLQSWNDGLKENHRNSDILN